MIGTLIRIHWITLQRDRVAQVMRFVLPIAFFTIFALVFGGRPQHRLAEAGDAEQPNAFRVDVLVRLEVIEDATESPSPGGDRSAIIRWIRVQIKSAQTFRRIRAVGLDVAMVKSGHGIAAVDRLFD